MSNDLPVTIGFDDSRPAGFVQLNDKAITLIEDMYLNDVVYVLSPEILVNKRDLDGNPLEVETLGSGVLPATNAMGYGSLLGKIAEMLEAADEREESYFVTAGKIVELIKRGNGDG